MFQLRPFLLFMLFSFLPNMKAADSSDPLFFSMVVYVRDGDYTTPRDHWNNADLNFDGLKTVCAMLDEKATQAAGQSATFPLTIILEIPPTTPDRVAFTKERLRLGNELAIRFEKDRAAIGASLDVAPDLITVIGAMWGDEETPERTARDVRSGIKTKFDAVLEGDSLIGETIDLGHNWEGRPFFPYYVQYRPDQPWMSSMANRELREKDAPLDLLWLTRSPWSDYDRYCFTYSFHLGDINIGRPARGSQGNIWFWKNEVVEWEKNFKAGNIPYAHLSVCSEGCVVAPDCGDIGLDIPKGNYLLLGELAEMLFKRGWTPVTGEQFQSWYAQRWPSPETPPKIIVFNDTAREPDGKFHTAEHHRNDIETQDMGQILIAETKYFRIVDHQHRLSPFLEIACELETPNLYVASYAGTDLRTDEERQEPNHMAKTFTDGTGSVGARNQLPVTAQTGNALFWGEDPHRGTPSKWSTQAPALGVPAEAPKNRCYTLLVDGEDVQFPKNLDFTKPYGTFFDVERTEESVAWKKRVNFNHKGQDVSLVIAHRLEGKQHHVNLVDEAGALDGAKLELAFRPHFYPGWLKEQERMVYGTASGMTGEAFAYQTDNAEDVEKRIELDSPLVTEPFLKLYHCDPTRLEMGRMVNISLPVGIAKAVRFIDPKGSWIYTEARAELDSLAGFTLRYRRLDGLSD